MRGGTRRFAFLIVASAWLSGCGGAQGQCTVDEESIARRVAELVDERLAERAEGGGAERAEAEDDAEDEDGDDDGDDGDADEADDRVPRTTQLASRPGPVRAPIAATPFSDTPPAAPAAAAPLPRPALRPPPGEPEPRVFVSLGRSPTRGPEGALVTLVAFLDFDCPYCGRLVPTLATLRERYPDELRIVFKHFPLPHHARAMPAAGAAVEALVQGGDTAFWAMFDRLFANQRALSTDDLVGHASALGLDAERLRAAVEGQVHVPAVQSDLALAAALRAYGSPTMFMNGTRIGGAVPLEVLVAAVDAELVVARAALRRGTPRARIYETIANGAARQPRGTR